MNRRRNILAILCFVLTILSCQKEYNDFSDYETRVSYFDNIRPKEHLNDSSLTVVTWNIKLAFGVADNPWSPAIGGTSDHLDSLVYFLRNLDPDIVLLQEVPLDRENTVVKKVLDSIAVRLNYNFAFGGHGFNSNGTYPTRAQWGNAILSKYEITEIANREVFNLYDKWSRRSVLKTNIELLPNYFIDCYSLHYTTDARTTEEFIAQIPKTVDFINETNFPKIFGGDFNYSRSIDTFFQYTNCLPNGVDVIDRIYFSTHFEQTSYNTISNSLDYSDHFAGVVTFQLK